MASAVAVSVLIALSLSSVTLWAAKTQLLEAFSLVTVARTELTLSRAESGVWPVTAAAVSSLATDSELGQFVDHIDTLPDGSIHTTLHNHGQVARPLRGRRLVLVPFVPARADTAPVVWRCRAASGPPAAAVAAPVIDTAYLPAVCREP
ncbi:MAG: pilin [Pseudomonadota bacterium]